MKPLYCGLFAGAVLSAHGQVFFTFDYTYDTSGFFSGENSYRQSTLEAAGQRVSSYLTQQSLTAVTGSSTLYVIDPASNGGSTIQVDNVSLAANEIRVYVGAYAYGTGVLAQAGPGMGFADDQINLENRGTTFNPAAIGSMSFNSDLFSGSVYWDQDVSNYEDPNPSGADFDAYTFIQHELLHVLGYGTGNAWNDLIVNGAFTGANSVAVYGSNVPLSADNAHWAASVVSTDLYGNSQATLMNPFLYNDERWTLTELDLAGLRDIGWNAAFPSSIPEPSAFAMLAGVGAIGVACIRRRRKG